MSEKSQKSYRILKYIFIDTEQIFNNNNCLVTIVYWYVLLIIYAFYWDFIYSYKN